MPCRDNSPADHQIYGSLWRQLPGKNIVKQIIYIIVQTKTVS